VEFQLTTECLIITQNTLHFTLFSNIQSLQSGDKSPQTAVSVWLLLSWPVLLLPLATVVVSLAPLLLPFLVLLLGSGVSWTLVTVGAAVWEMRELLLPRLAWRWSTR